MIPVRLDEKYNNTYHQKTLKLFGRSFLLWRIPSYLLSLEILLWNGNICETIFVILWKVVCLLTHNGSSDTFITNHNVKCLTLRRQNLKHGYDRSPLRLQHRLIKKPGDISWATNLPIPKSYFPPIRNLLSIYLFNSCIIGYSINRFTGFHW